MRWCSRPIWHCPGNCRNVGKRSKISNETRHFPCKFAAYDLDGNGKITYKEFVKSQKMKADDKGNQKVFKLADRDDDKVLTCKELSDAPFRFACIVVCKSDKDQEDVEEMIY